MDKEKLVNAVKYVSKDMSQRMNEQYGQNIDESFYQGYDLCMIKTADLLVDTNLKDDVVVALLQKHFNLRLTEAEDMIRTAKNRKARRLSEKK